METKSMETKDILLQLRTKAGLSQDELYGKYKEFYGYVFFIAKKVG